jgi:hypothetical protein
VGLNDSLGLSETAGDRLADVGRHALVSTLLQAVFCRLAGYGVVNDAERLAMIPSCARREGGSWCSLAEHQMGAVLCGRFFRERPGQHELGLKHGVEFVDEPIQGRR